MCDYPTNHTSSPLLNFVASNFIVDSTKLFYFIDDKRKFTSKSDLTKNQLNEIWKNGELGKKSITFVDNTGAEKNWKPIEKSNGNALELCIRHAGIFVIDIDGRSDTDKTFSWNDIPELLHTLPYTLSRTKGLPHFFFRLTGIDAQKLMGVNPTTLKGFRLGQDNLNFCKGDFLNNHTWERMSLDAKVFNYNGVIPTLEWNDVKTLMKPGDAKKLEIQAGLHQPVLPLKRPFVKESTSEEEDDSTSEESFMRSSPIAHQASARTRAKAPDPTPTEQRKRFELVKKLKFSAKRLSGFGGLENGTWKRFTCAFINEFGSLGDEAKILWDELSRTGTGYDKARNYEIWDEFLKMRESPSANQLKWGSIVKWATEDYPENKTILKGVEKENKKARKEESKKKAIEVGDADPDELYLNPQYLELKENFEEHTCKIRESSQFVTVVKNEDGSVKKHLFRDRVKLRTSYEDILFKHRTFDGERIKSTDKSFIDTWLKDPNMRQYENAEVIPSTLPCPSGTFNLWIDPPFEKGIEEFELDPENEGLQMYLNHIRVLCNEDETTYSYLFRWIAHTIQRPHEKSPRIVLVGQEGCGKGRTTDTIRELHGVSKVFETTTPERDIWGSFNMAMVNAFIVLLSETDKRNSHNADGKIKGLITDSLLPVNGKGLNQFSISSYHRFIQSSNHLDAVPTHEGDRRNFIVRCNDEFIGNREYFSEFDKKIVSNQKNLRHIYKFFKTLDIVSWNQWEIPRTLFHKEIINASRPFVDLFLDYILMSANAEVIGNCPILDGWVYMTSSQIFEQFEEYKKMYGTPGCQEKTNAGSLVKMLLTHSKIPQGAITTMKKKSNNFTAINVAVLTKYFEKQGY